MTSQETRGRPRSSSHQALEAVAVELFLERGFEQTTIPDIAAAAGIGRSTFFSYFPSKADIVWRPFDDQLTILAAHLAARPLDEPLSDALLAGIMQGLRDAGDPNGVWLRRFIVQEASGLRDQESARWARWAAVVADFAQSRIQGERSELTAATIGGAVQALLLSLLRREAPAEVGTEAILTDIERELRQLLSALRPWASHMAQSAQRAQTAQ